MVQDMMNIVSASALVDFIDGSCIPNPGPCGAGAVITIQMDKKSVLRDMLHHMVLFFFESWLPFCQKRSI